MGMKASSKTWTVAVLAFTFLAAGCAAPDQIQGSPPAASPVSEITPDVALCQGNEIPLEALENRRLATELGPEALPALSGRDVEQFHAESWLIAQESSSRVMLMNKLAEPKDDGTGDVREYVYVIISTDSMASEPGKPVWAVVEASACTPTLDLGDLRAGAVTLDPSSRPDPNGSSVPLLVTEFDCNSGQNAEGRVKVVKLVETETTVEVVVGVRRAALEAASCQSNPHTPFTVHLERPLGDRAVVNAAVVPSREIILPSRR
ncbi:hypothetical protein [Paenarthrobacter sp. NPDC018779]|uniref:hypothetical protein n=1 Tax=Paenarthrobacter sp. NPDC018779 TaxID=3364375 RepID=UPI0037C5BE50